MRFSSRARRNLLWAAVALAAVVAVVRFAHLYFEIAGRHH